MRRNEACTRLQQVHEAGACGDIQFRQGTKGAHEAVPSRRLFLRPAEETPEERWLLTAALEIQRVLHLAELDRRNIIFGRPGTGKTYTINSLIKQYLEQGGSPYRIMYLTYSKSMAQDARNRFALPKGAMVGTFHSVLSKFLGWKYSPVDEHSDYLGSKDLKEFARAMGFSTTDDPNSYDAEQDGEDDFSRFLEAYYILKSGVPQATLDALFQTSEFDVGYVAEQYEKMKESTGKHDYIDILTEGLNLEFHPVPLLIVDESQDLTPLMWRIVDKIAEVADSLVLAGDDMQTIYTFRGASVEELLARRDRYRVFHLTKSWRLPESIKSLSDMLVSRVDKHENVKYTGNGTEGKVFRQPIDLFLRLEGAKWILCRTKFTARRIGSTLMSLGVPFLPINDRHRWLSPWDNDLIAVNNALARYPHNDLRDLTILAQYLPTHYFARGVKSDLTSGNGDKVIRQYSTGLYGQFSTEYILQKPMTAADLYRGLEVSVNKKTVMEPWLGKIITPPDVVRVDTIHASKGLEVRNVALVTDLSGSGMKKLEENPSEEHRIFFTGMTRSHDTLTIMSLDNRRVYEL